MMAVNRLKPGGAARKGAMSLWSSIRLCLMIAMMAGTPDSIPAAWAEMPSPDYPLTMREPLEPVPTPPLEDPGMVALGRTLFFDTRLSSDGSASCATCHDPFQGGTDGIPLSISSDGVPGLFNTPTLFNVGFARALWLARSRTKP